MRRIIAKWKWVLGAVALGFAVLTAIGAIANAVEPAPPATLEAPKATPVPAAVATDAPAPPTATPTPPVREWSEAYRNELAAVAASYHGRIAAVRGVCGPHDKMKGCALRLQTEATDIEKALYVPARPQSPSVCMAADAGAEMAWALRDLAVAVSDAAFDAASGNPFGEPHMTLDAFYAKLDGLDALVDAAAAGCATPMCGTPEGDALGDDCFVPFRWPP